MLSAVLFALALAAAPAHAIIRLPGIPAQVAGNPAERLLSMPIEDPVYDPATRCSRKPRPGMAALQGRLEALARRMGVEEMIWDCGYWRAGMTQFEDYPPCFNRRGFRRRRVDPTVAHRYHIHIGLTKAGAARRTSFWSAAR